MGRINIEIPDEIHRLIKSECALKGIVLSDYIANAIEKTLVREERK
ncbi:hypothetical protein JXA85_03850 [Candidatus Woesearchaeota archaeon]|nr:hypothetical protein [Candidatus Woesearchaeota archaeon]